MKLLALLIGLLVERLATQLFHLRELRWLDRVIDYGFVQAGRLATWPPLIPVVLIVFVLVLPVWLVMLSLGDALFGFPYLIVAVVVLFFSLGPRDIGEEVDEYCAALEAGDEARELAKAKALLEREPPEEPLERGLQVQQAVCVQANNRLFAVIFWFMLLGPLGAWLYRASDLVRRRAVFKAAREEEGIGVASLLVGAAADLHGWLAWIPARLCAMGYALAGNFDGAFAAWRRPAPPSAASLPERSEHLLAAVGGGALSTRPPFAEGGDLREHARGGAIAAKRLVFRALIIWAAVIAAMTLYGWAV